MSADLRRVTRAARLMELEDDIAAIARTCRMPPLVWIRRYLMAKYGLRRVTP